MRHPKRFRSIGRGESDALPNSLRFADLRLRLLLLVFLLMELAAQPAPIPDGQGHRCRQEITKIGNDAEIFIERREQQHRQIQAGRLPLAPFGNCAKSTTTDRGPAL